MTRYTFLPALRELVRCYQAFESLASEHIRTLGVTPAQFDIIATLGNTPGMTFKQLGEKTLITKGTLTGVVDRLAARQLVRRIASPTDGRSQIVQLTPEGERMFEEIFPRHLDYIGQVLGNAGEADLAQIQDSLHRLRAMLEGVQP
jgi:DNA-binding MarR family transcriptional regulator